MQVTRAKRYYFAAMPVCFMSFLASEVAGTIASVRDQSGGCATQTFGLEGIPGYRGWSTGYSCPSFPLLGNGTQPT